MKSNQKSQAVLENEDGHPSQIKQPKEGSDLQKSSPIVENVKIKTATQKERPDNDHQHDSKYPVGGKNSSGKSQKKITSSDKFRNQGPKQGNSKGKDSGAGADSKG